jgi:hypothetical protein
MYQSRFREGSAFLEHFLRFIYSDMLNPERKLRTDCDDAVKFLDSHVPQDVDMNYCCTLR